MFINNATIIRNILFETIFFTLREKEVINLAFRASKTIGMGWRSPENKDFLFLIMKGRVEIKNEIKVLTVFTENIYFCVYVWSFHDSLLSKHFPSGLPGKCPLYNSSKRKINNCDGSHRIRNLIPKTKCAWTQSHRLTS